MPHPAPAELSGASDAYFLGRWFTGARRAGFLATLPADAWHTLSAVLSFTSRDGLRAFTLDQLALALGLSRQEASRRLEQLCVISWQGTSLIRPEHHPLGEVCGAKVAAIEPLAAIRFDASLEARTPSESLPGSLIDEMAQVGLNHAQIDSLAHRFPESEIRRQLDWLPARSARNPAALLIRAIEQDWDEPKESL